MNEKAMKFTEYNEDFGRPEFGKQFECETSKIVALQSLLLGNELSEKETSSIRQYKVVQEFLDLPLHDKKEGILKKLFAATAVIAQKKGFLSEEGIPNTPEDIASLVDEGLTRLKVAYQTGKGELEPEEAIDALIDQATVRAIAFTDALIEKEMPVAIDKLCTFMVKKYPKTAPLALWIKRSEKVITHVTKQVVRKGIQTMAKAAKPIVRTIVGKAKKVSSKNLSFLKA